MKQHCTEAESVLGTHSNDWIFSRAIKKIKNSKARGILQRREKIAIVKIIVQ